MTETDAALPRETGQEKSTQACPNCGAELGVQETPYGSTAAVACPKCYPATDPNAARQQASSPSLPREVGTPVGATPPTAPGSAGADAPTEGGA